MRGEPGRPPDSLARLVEEPVPRVGWGGLWRSLEWPRALPASVLREAATLEGAARAPCLHTVQQRPRRRRPSGAGLAAGAGPATASLTGTASFLRRPERVRPADGRPRP